ncbi:glycosyl hydrolase family 28 protein [Psittacicella gerlachiana]|uniref:Pectate lyase superfamily protein domain-containing protein n=1 Tax=Psittacicella gerlachiana TaxID=2028574 RepID=A0A3A1YLA7_9GAMM|nr:glycosyl hydrolase family 28 protein [Psittacicella gerlachiana]RIY36797.1 hypothetical protein CKF59_02215 [Psittacicella gerlachiana]
MSKMMQRTFLGILGMGVTTLALAVPQLQQEQVQELLLKPRNPCQSLTATAGDSTNVIQSALTACAGKGAVVLETGAFKVQNLTLPAETVLYINRGASLERLNPQVNEVQQALATRANQGFLVVTGDKVAIVGGGKISGNLQAQVNYTFSDKKQAEKAQKAQEKAQKEQEKISKDLISSPQVLELPALIRADKVNNLVIAGISLVNYLGNALYVAQADNVQVYHVKVYENQAFANGVVLDGVSNAVLHTNYLLTTGAQVLLSASKAQASRLCFESNYLYSGFGFMLGLNLTHGLQDLRVDGLVVNQAENGIALLTNNKFGGQVAQVDLKNIYVYQANQPLQLDLNYDNYHNVGTKIPQVKAVKITNFYALGGGKVEFVGNSASNPLKVELENIRIAKVNSWRTQDAQLNYLDNSRGEASLTQVKRVIEEQLKQFPRYLTN